jgi:phage minor structural protein
LICVYPPDCTDFSSNGLGPISPSSCTVTETLNGEWELTLEHPLDAQGKWRRLIEGNILRAPVPAAFTPHVNMVPQTGGGMVYRVSTSRDPLRLRSGTGTKYKILAKYKKGTEIIVLNKTTSSWYEVSCPDGKRGYMASQYLTYVRTEPTPVSAGETLIEPRQLRDQPFRIYRAVPELTKITIYARHVFYDLMDNMLKSYKPAANVTGAVVVQNISSKCLTEHDFEFYSDLDSTADEVEFENVNPVDALLGEGGVVEKYGGELARDWFDAFVVKRVGTDTDVQIREGKNLLGISYDVDLTDVVTRIMPTGETKDGKTLYLDELFVDSPHISEYPHPKWIHLPVSEANVSKDMTTAQAKAKMRSAAQAEYDAGCDLPTVTLKVDFINCADTVEYAQYKALQNIFLGDAVRVIARRIGIAVSMRLTQYTYDCLTRKYTALTLGTVADTIEGNMISSRQLATGMVSGAKLAMGSVGTGQLKDGSVGSLQIGMAAIQTAHIEAAAITSALIQHAAIQTAHIGEAQITAAQIEDATITAAKIASATITAAQIANATITSAQIKDAAISAAKIALATITSAQIAEAAIESANIADLAVTTAKIADAAVDTAKIKDAAITNAKIGKLAVGQANIQEAAIGEAQIREAAITYAKIADLAVRTGHIDDLAVTTAKIAQAAITNAKIENAAIDTAKIALGAITAALIEDGAIGTAQIADASITDAKIVELSANRITTGVLSVERLIIRGSEQSLIYQINNMGALISTQVDTIDGYALTERTITADKIVAHSLTANEIAARSITANEILAGTITGAEIAAETITGANVKAGTLTTSHVVANFGEALLLESAQSVRTIVKPDIAEALNAINVGGVNLIDNSASHTIVGDDTNTFWMAADELSPGGTYTFSVQEIIKDAGSAAGVTWAVLNADTLAVAETGTLDFTYGRQKRTFTAPGSDANWAFVLYAGLSGATNGVSVTFNRAQLEEGDIATSWRASPQDNEARFGDIGGTIDRLDEGFVERVQALIAEMGLSDQFASVDDFLALLDRVDLVRSDLDQQDSSLQLTFTRLTAAEGSIAEIFSHFEFGDENGTPYLDMWASESQIKMRLTNTRLAFIQGSFEVAYFSDNKLFVTQLEVIERISVGTNANGYLDIVTTPTGVGFKWRT